ncbi:MAG TPA: nicotinate-nucleotide adenylyltransferase [Ktedonobacterales bacterium]|nr:nicotinate-nucleotide adenylyltransferase [Ktedonobacterales bacterium]
MREGPTGAPAEAGPRYGILGGTFDPPHLAHLLLAQEALVHLALERVYFVPAGQPPHKIGRTISPAADRGAMVARAIASNPQFALSTVEMDHAGFSYTARTLGHLRARWGAEAQVYLILGWDMLLDLPGWYDPEEVIRQITGLAVMHRPGYADDAVELAQVMKALPALADKLTVVPAPLLEIAASELRQRVAVGLPVRYFVPDGVADYIAEHRLYRARAGADHALEPNTRWTPRAEGHGAGEPGAISPDTGGSDIASEGRP